MSKKEKKKNKQASPEEKQIVIINNIQPPSESGPEYRTASLYGDITESSASDLVSSMLFLERTAPVVAQEDPEDPESDVIQYNRDMRVVISTNGGIASEMFAIIDVMDSIKENTCDIETLAIGKVMSAGVPVLASGTKGKRKIGKNCRVMLHGVQAGTAGSISNMEKDIEEVKWIQERYIECLTSNTKLTKAKIKKMLKSGSDVYLTSEEAIKYGIADVLV